MGYEMREDSQQMDFRNDPKMRSYRMDRRRQRAMVLEAAIMQIVGKYVPDDRERDCMRDLARELFEKLHAEGVEIITDATRAEAGLPPRGPDGWTQDELRALEHRRLEVMMAPTAPMAIFELRSNPEAGDAVLIQNNGARAITVTPSKNQILRDPAMTEQDSLTVFPDQREPNDWRVEYQDEDGGCYVVIFAGPEAEKRARAYFAALKSGALDL